MFSVHMTPSHLRRITPIGSRTPIGYLGKDRVRDTRDSDTRDIPSRIGNIHGMDPPSASTKTHHLHGLGAPSRSFNAPPGHPVESDL